MMKRNAGFTLVELIITIAVATLLTAAATSILVLGLRINAKTTDNVKQQNATNMLAYAVQNIAENRDIYVNEDKTAVQNENGSTDYIKFEGDIVYLNGNVFMEDVSFFEAKLSDDTKLLTITLRTNGKEYTASAYCRLNPIPTSDEGGTTE